MYAGRVRVCARMVVRWASLQRFASAPPFLSASLSFYVLARCKLQLSSIAGGGITLNKNSRCDAAVWLSCLQHHGTLSLGAMIVTFQAFGGSARKCKQCANSGCGGGKLFKYDPHTSQPWYTGQNIAQVRKRKWWLLDQNDGFFSFPY